MTNLTFKRLLPTVALLLLASACQQGSRAEDESATASPITSVTAEVGAKVTVAAMLQMAQRGDWGAYVDTYYGESDKFSSEADRNALVERFEQTWGTQVVGALQQAVGVTPVIEGGRATFSVDGQPVFVLYRSDDGRWTFHL